MCPDQLVLHLETRTHGPAPGAWHDIPSWYAISGADRAIDPDLERCMAERAGSTTVQFDDASHVGGLTHYSARFVKLIEQAADATN